ncbi:helix-turn-helix domain-containing protein [Candidatus Uhrbacteria bacterium]|nr:helix-turn-helix domain-containing protein [Candidatus Uhrbacteria bacterium]
MFISCEAIQAPVNGCLVKHERESTRRAKDQFLALYERMGGVSVSHVASRVGISRDTYYRWLKEDERFKLRINETEEQLNGIVEDLLLMKILKGDGASIRFYLTRRHPKYMLRRSTVPTYTETKTLEDLLDEGIYA